MICGIALVKDEADVIERTIRHMAGQVDHILIADNASTDGTREILAELATSLPVTAIDNHEVAHYQGRKLTSLAQLAADFLSAEWVVPFDADELLEASSGTVADAIRRHRRAWIMTSQLIEYRPTTSDPTAADPFARIQWRRAELNPLLKIAARTHPDLKIGEGSHTCDYAGSYPHTVGGELLVRHFPYRSPEQFVTKMRNGARGRNATTLPADVGNHLRAFGRILNEHGPGELQRIYRDEYVVQNPEADPTMTHDPVSCA